MNHPAPGYQSLEPLLGAHMSISGGRPKAIERAEEVNSTALQIFVKNASRWKGPEISEEEKEEFRTRRKQSALRSVVAHDSYLINLASPDDDLWSRSISAFIDELKRCEMLDLDYLVAHPGAHMDSEVSEGIRRIAEAIDLVHRRVGDLKVKIALETTAGQGTTLGYRFEQLRDILDQCRQPEWLFICLDTCHVFAAGYDIRSAEHYERTFESFGNVLGLGKLKVIHLNDSKRELGSRIDRHDHIGQGKIGEEAFRLLMNDDRLVAVPKILETPKGDDDSWDRKNLMKLRGMVSG